MASPTPPRPASQNSANQQPAVLTADKLAELACLLGNGSSGTESAFALVKRAIEIWDAANQAVLFPPSDKATYEDGEITFTEIAEQKLLPSRRGPSHIDSSKGVKKAVENYFVHFEKELPKTFDARLILPEQQKMLFKTLKTVSTNAISSGRVSRSILEALRKFQNTMRERNSHTVTVDEIRAVLGEVEIGRRNPDI